MNLRTYLYRKREAAKRAVYRQFNGYCNVLLYHRVIQTDYDPQLLAVSPENFHAQLSVLKKKGTFLRMEEFCAILGKKGKFPKNSFLITFDDGYEDNFTNALPILEDLGLEATFYIATKQLFDPGLFWWDELDLVYHPHKQNRRALEEIALKRGLKNSQELYAFYINACKTVNTLGQRDSLVREFSALTRLTDMERSRYKFLSIEQLKQFADSPSAVIAAHTINHLSLGHLPREKQKEEITGSINQLSEILAKDIEHFSFPYGEKQHFNNDTLDICKTLNLKSAAANYYTYVTNKEDIHSFPRLVIRNDDPKVLLQKLNEVLI